jgi:hypothetical protein
VFSWSYAQLGVEAVIVFGTERKEWEPYENG